MTFSEYRVRDYATEKRDCASANAITDECPITLVIAELKTIGERVAWARKQRKLTQQQLATNAGVAQSTIGSLESGQRSKPRELNSIAKALDCSVAWLETGEGEWEAVSRETGAIFEQLLPELLQGSLVSVRKITPSDRADMPPWIRAVSPWYVPDFAMRLPGTDVPVYVEVKSNHTPTDRIQPYIELAAQRPTEFAVWQVDPAKPRLGLDDFLADLRHHLGEANAGPDRGPEWGSWGGPPEAVDENRGVSVAEAPPPSFGSPILAWNYEDELPKGEFVMVPRLDVRLSEGSGPSQVVIGLKKENAQAFRSEWIRQAGLKPNKLAAMRATGDSMEPTIHEGDSLLVDTSQVTVVDGKVYALWYDGGERVKRLFRLPGGGLRISSDNQKFPTLELQAESTEHVRIIGRVVHRSGVGGL